MQGRYFRPKPASLRGTPYDSTTEQRLHEGVLKVAEHHPEPIPYEWPHRYTPDFKIQMGELSYLIEVKGYFQDRNDCTKYLWIREALPINTQLIFVFETPNKPIHFQSKRKDGSKMTHAEWAEKNGFVWYTEEQIVEIL